MNKVANLSFLSLAVSIALFGTSPTLKADMCSDCTNKDFPQCVSECPKESKAKAACIGLCAIALGICKGTLCPKLFAVRNASMFSMNFFREKDGKLLGTRGKISPSPLGLDGSDFPVVAAREDKCPDLKDPKCTTNAQFGYVLKNPGCYVLWKLLDDSDIYPTPEVCWTQSKLKSTEHTKPVSPPPAPPQSKKPVIGGKSLPSVPAKK